VTLRHLEKGLLIVGLILVAVYVLAKVHSQISARIAVQKFRSQESESQPRAQEAVKLPTGQLVDFSLWSEKRVKAYMESLAIQGGTPPALLSIPKLHLEVPVYDGTDDLTLDRGVGRIIGTARLGESGNIGIAGHRDGFFRGLKDVGPGDTLDLILPSRTDHYIIEKILITDPEDVSVLQPRARFCLTLVTCYPFYYVGSAPKRYIVQASISNSGQPALGNQADPAVPAVQSFNQSKKKGE
jgi:sortase A